MSPRRPLLLAFVTATAIGAGAPALGRGPDAAPAGSTRPRLVLFVSVDQMRADYLVRFRSAFGSGLKRLLEQGAVFTNARYRHACTETGPGHSVMLSGRSPRSSGIVANGWYDRTLSRSVNVVDDPAVRVLGGAGRAASPTYFNGFTVGDLLKAGSPRSHVVAVSFKDRAAILMAGKRADAAYWYEARGGRFVTSSWYMTVAPAWLERWNGRGLAGAFSGRLWERLLADTSLYERLAGPDDVEGEGDGHDTVFPHLVAGTPPNGDYYDALRRSPFADDVLLDFALTAMKAHGLGASDATDLLAVSFSACDIIGHRYGPDSQELMDYLLRLDRTLGRLLDAAEGQAGKGRVLLVLTADHGVMPLVEVLRAKGLPARRASSEELQNAVDHGLAERFPGATGFFRDAEPLQYVFDDAAIARQGLKRTDVEEVVRRSLLETGLIDAVYSARELAGPPRPEDPFFDAHQRAFFARRSGDLVSRVKPYVYMGSRSGGTGHGSPHDYDRHVPIVFLAPGIAPGPRDLACGPEDIAWALGRLLGLDYPQQDAATDLLPALRP